MRKTYMYAAGLVLACVATSLAAADVEDVDNQVDLQATIRALRRDLDAAKVSSDAAKVSSDAANEELDAAKVTIKKQNEALEKVKVPLETRVGMSEVHELGPALKESSLATTQTGGFFSALMTSGSFTMMQAGSFEEEEAEEEALGEQGATTATNVNTNCYKKCTPACRAEHEASKTTSMAQHRKYPVCDLPDFSKEGLKRINGDVEGGGIDCATSVSVPGTTKPRYVCTSCGEGRALIPIDWGPKSLAQRRGYCVSLKGTATTTCTELDKSHKDASPLSKATLCTKSGTFTALFAVRKLKVGSPEYEHFKSTLGGVKNSKVIVKCTVAKYTACRNGECAVSKTVRCADVCKHAGIGSIRSGHTEGKDCNPALCGGVWRTTAKGAQVPYGTLACMNIAAMA